MGVGANERSIRGEINLASYPARSITRFKVVSAIAHFMRLLCTFFVRWVRLVRCLFGK
jgi:hypothetical protein